jgi:hypothetical protein
LAEKKLLTVSRYNAFRSLDGLIGFRVNLAGIIVLTVTRTDTDISLGGMARILDSITSIAARSDSLGLDRFGRP